MVRFAIASLIVCLGSLASAQCRYDATTTPLIDLTGSYLGESGGLYGGGSNTPPPALSTEGIRRAEAIAPIDGSIVLVSVGMSNTTQEFSRFVPLAMGHPDVNPALVVVDGAQGSEPAMAWTDPDAPTWNEVDRRLGRAGVDASQVQVAWIKQAVPGPRGGFPEHAEMLQGHLEAIARALRTNYPNIQLAFFSSRTRACTDRGLNPEPYAYESAFSVRWLIEAQQSGDPTLDPDARAPLIAWGPYLWADETPRSDGFSWTCSEVRDDDCTHPSMSGQTAVAQQLLTFFRSDPMAAPWFLRAGAARPDAGPRADAGVATDAGGPDAGPDASGSDAGAEADAGTDGGPVVDAAGSLDGGSTESGGGCSVSSGTAFPWFVLLFARRRTRQ